MYNQDNITGQEYLGSQGNGGEKSGPSRPAQTTPEPVKAGGLDVLRSNSLCPLRPLGLTPIERGHRQDTLLNADENVLLLHANSHVPVDSKLPLVPRRDEVIVDSGATDSICPNLSMMTNFKPSTIRIGLADWGSTSIAKGRGSIELLLQGPSSSKHVIINNVIWNPTNRGTLISAGDLQDVGIATHLPEYSNKMVLYDAKKRFSVASPTT